MVTRVETEKEREPYGPGYRREEAYVAETRSVLLNRISWGAVFAGVAVALTVQLILNMIGIGVGAATIDPGAGGSPSLFGFSIGAAIWWTVSGLIAAFVGGFAAGRLAGEPRRQNGGWHGFVTWCLSTLVVFWLLTSSLTTIVGGTVNNVTNMAGGIMSAVSGVAATVTETASTAIGGDDQALATIRGNIEEMAGSETTQETIDAAVAAIRVAITGGDDPQVIDEAAQALATARDIPVSEARTDVEGYIDEYQQTVTAVGERAAAMTDAAADTIASITLLATVALILGGLVAWWGGRMGAGRLTSVEEAHYHRRHKQEEEGVIH